MRPDEVWGGASKVFRPFLVLGGDFTRNGDFDPVWPCEGMGDPMWGRQPPSIFIIFTPRHDLEAILGHRGRYPGFWTFPQITGFFWGVQGGGPRFSILACNKNHDLLIIIFNDFQST